MSPRRFSAACATSTPPPSTCSSRRRSTSSAAACSSACPPTPPSSDLGCRNRLPDVFDRPAPVEPAPSPPCTVVRMRRALLTALAAAAAIAPAAIAKPALPLGHAGRWITDAHGRVVVLHGINMVYKRPPYAPDATGFGDDDAK